MLNLPEGVWFGTYNRNKLEQIWQRIQGFDNLFADDRTRSKEAYMSAFLARDSVILETDGGFLMMKNIIEGLRGEVHFCFWDKKLSPRADLMKDCILWAFGYFDLARVETQVADYANAVRRFISEKLGFVYEGTRRNFVYHQGRLIDMHMYSILREEVL
jgi:hypothetical protein